MGASVFQVQDNAVITPRITLQGQKTRICGYQRRVKNIKSLICPELAWRHAATFELDVSHRKSPLAVYGSILIYGDIHLE